MAQLWKRSVSSKEVLNLQTKLFTFAPYITLNIFPSFFLHQSRYFECDDSDEDYSISEDSDYGQQYATDVNSYANTPIVEEPEELPEEEEDDDDEVTMAVHESTLSLVILDAEIIKNNL